MPDAVHLPTAATAARTKVVPPAKVDVVIIGAGLGGLMTAARLAQAGRSVAVIDAHYVAGGCATMFSRGSGDQRVNFDIGLHYVGGCGPGGRIPPPPPGPARAARRRPRRARRRPGRRRGGAA